MQSIKMLKQIPGSPDGIHSFLYEKDKVYPTDEIPLSEPLIKVFVEIGVAEKVNEEKQEIIPENKALDGSKENKGALAKAKASLSSKKNNKRNRD